MQNQRPPKLTMTLDEVAVEFRRWGISIEKGRLADGIASGDYPIGRVVRASPGGRRTFEIWRCDVEAFLASKIPPSMGGSPDRRIIEFPQCHDLGYRQMM